MGFKVQPPAPVQVIAGENELTCGKKLRPGIYCERPEHHAGGHLSESHNLYWPAEERRS